MHRYKRLMPILALLPALGHALTIDPNIEVRSALGQPFQGKIALTGLGALEADDIHVRLGNSNDFLRLGLVNSYYAPDLEFKVVVGRDGGAYIDVSTTRPVNEPSMDFVVDVSWPNNDRLSEVAVTLDPPPKN